MQENLEHSIYTHQKDIKNADAVAWVLTGKDSQLQQYPFTFPEIADDEVRIKITYSGLCQSDALHGRSLWANAKYPICTGHEIIGEVTKVGAGVKDFAIGETVGVGPQGNHCEGCDACKRGDTNLCVKFQGLYDPYFGGYASHIQCKARQTFKVPEGMPLEKIPPLLCAGMTVWAPIKRWYDAQKNKDNLKAGVFGIGGLGHLAIQYLAKLGVQTTAFTTSFQREELMKSLGAHDLSHSTDLASLSSEKVVHQYDVIVNTIFNEDKEQFLAIQRSIKKGGQLIQVGLPPTRTTQSLDVMNLVFHQISISGSIVASVQETKDMLEFSAKNKIYPIVEEFPFEEFDKAFDKLENGRPQFRCVVNVKDWAKKNGFDN